MNETKTFHGSDLEKIAEFYQIPKEEICCYSANVNPLGFPEHTAELISDHFSDLMTCYPDREYSDLKKAIGRYCSVDPDYVLVGNGSTELISLFIQSVPVTHAVQIGPSYSEYERELKLADISYSTWFPRKDNSFHPDISELIDFLTKEHADFLILCNPNNPTASALSLEDLSELLSACLKQNIFVMIDETYAEFAEHNVSAFSFIPSFSNLMIIRGVSKFFAAPGLRLGYGASSNVDFLRHVKKHQNPWSVNSVAAFAGVNLFSETEFIVKTKALISSERTRMIQGLSKISDLSVYPSDSNFIFAEILNPIVTSSDLFEFLIRKNMMIRDCSSFPGLGSQFFRFCIMLPDENNRLLHAIEEFFYQLASS